MLDRLAQISAAKLEEWTLFILSSVDSIMSEKHAQSVIQLTFDLSSAVTQTIVN